MSSIEYEDALVDNIAVMMKGKLRANAHKPSWVGADPMHLLKFLEAEVAELREALETGAKPGHVKMECADVGNFAAMIAWAVAEDGPDHNEGLY